MRTAEDTGYFGPGSAIWHLNQEAVLGIGLGRAVLLQMAHPWVAQAIADHSTFQQRPLQRLLAIVSAAELLVFGSRRQADEVAAHLCRMHAGIRGTLREDVGTWRAGTPYRADDPAALLWVLVTLIDTTLRVYEASLGPLPPTTVRAYLRDVARLGALLGIPAQTVPAEPADVEQYMTNMIASGRVAVGATARAVAHALMQAPVPAGRAWQIYRAITHAYAVATLPPILRRQYGPVLALRHPTLWRIGGTVGRAVLPHLPPCVRRDPIAALAIQRGEQ